jgi:hypothetical protein
MLKSRLANHGTAAGVGVATAIAVYLIYNDALPTLADVKMAQPDDNAAESARKHAAWKSAALIGAVFFVARDLNSYLISGVALVGIDLMHKHANQVNPTTGRADVYHTQSVSDIRPRPEYDSE